MKYFMKDTTILNALCRYLNLTWQYNVSGNYAGNYTLLLLDYNKLLVADSVLGLLQQLRSMIKFRTPIKD